MNIEVDIDEEYYEDRLSGCCNAPIYFQTDICIVCGEHSEIIIIKNTEQ